MKLILKTLLLILTISLVNCKKEDKNLPPNISTLEVTEITATTAVCGGEIKIDELYYYDGFKGICYSTNPNPTIDDDRFPALEDEKLFSCKMINLSPNTKYYVRAFVGNGRGVKHGEQKEFITLAE